jgi:hypothetical protein
MNKSINSIRKGGLGANKRDSIYPTLASKSKIGGVPRFREQELSCEQIRMGRDYELDEVLKSVPPA